MTLVLTREDPRGGDHSSSFSSGPVSIGRLEGNSLPLPEGHISSRHAQIREAGDRWVLADLGSTNGTLVLRGEQKLLLGPRGQAEVTLRAGDLLVLGDMDQAVRLRVTLRAPAGPPREQGTVVATRVRSDTAQLGRRLTGDLKALQVIYGLVRDLAGQTGRQPILELVARAVLAAVPGAVDALVVLSGEGDRLTVAARAHRGDGLSREPDRAVCRRVLAGDKALLFGQHDEARVPAHTLVSRGVGSGIAAPLWSEGAALGVLQINCEPGRFELSAGHLDLAVVLAHHAAAALEKAELIARLRAAERRTREENRLLRRRTQPAVEMVAASPAMVTLAEELRRAADTDVTVLIQGETGTGKEVAARYLHTHSRRRDNLLVPVNCGALSESLLDSELFGYRKGAFTGAAADRKGVFEVARGGTVFLDEIGETPMSVQVRLLRVLEEGKIKVLGEAVERRVDARIVAATNQDLDAMVERGAFRRDLYYRLRVFPVQIPPLRRRPEDMEPLLRLFLDRFCRELGKPVGPPAPGLLELLRGHPFPGNVRELCNEVERAVVRAEPDQPLGPELFSEEVQQCAPAAPDDAEGLTLRQQVEQVERHIITATLERLGGKRVAAARELGLTRQGLAKKIARLGLNKTN